MSAAWPETTAAENDVPTCWIVACVPQLFVVVSPSLRAEKITLPGATTSGYVDRTQHAREAASVATLRARLSTHLDTLVERWTPCEASHRW
jgi:hypothetical protein